MLRIMNGVVGSLALSALLATGALTAQSGGGKGDPAKGKEIFENNQCAMCHSVDTDEKKVGPSLKGLFKKKTLSTGKPANDANVMGQINNGGGGMPGYQDSLSADDKANLLAYLHKL